MSVHVLFKPLVGRVPIATYDYDSEAEAIKFCESRLNDETRTIICERTPSDVGGFVTKLRHVWIGRFKEYQDGDILTINRPQIKELWRKHFAEHSLK